MRRIGILLAIALSLALAGCDRRPAQGRAHPEGEWPAYARDPGGMRHSPLTQVNRDNVRQLQVAWTFRTGELATYQGTQFPVDKVAFEATPIMVDGTLYFSTATGRTFALDAATGRQRWVYDPRIDLNVNYSNPVSRGVSTWVDPSRPLADP